MPMLLQVKKSTMESIKNGGCVAVNEANVTKYAGACYNLALPLAEYF